MSDLAGVCSSVTWVLVWVCQALSRCANHRAEAINSTETLCCSSHTFNTVQDDRKRKLYLSQAELCALLIIVMADQQFEEFLYTEYDDALSNPELLFSLWTVQTAERLIRFSPDLSGIISRQQDYRLLWQGDGVCFPDADLKSQSGWRARLLFSFLPGHFTHLYRM